MPKDTRTNSNSYRPRASPYACSSKNCDLKSERSLPPIGNEREWEEARCAICMEHPHNAVLLICSSREKGCQPYMCDTSYRHSNCLDQFSKSSSVGFQQEGNNVSGNVFCRGIRGQALSGPTGSHGQQQPKLLCPLCRGHVKGYIVVEEARKFMNSKTRSCSLETCNFVGNYAELRKHARCEHPSERPSEADPVRQSNWTRLEIQRGSEGALSAYEAPVGGNIFEDELVDGYSEAEEELSEDIDMLLDVEYEFSFSILDEFPLVPYAWDGSPRVSSEGSASRSESGARSPSVASGRSASQSESGARLPSVATGRSASRSESGARSQNRRYRRSVSRSNNHEVRPAAIRSRNLSSSRTSISSRTSSSSRDGRWDR